MFEKDVENNHASKKSGMRGAPIFSQLLYLNPKSKLISPLEYFNCQKLMLQVPIVINL